MSRRRGGHRGLVAVVVVLMLVALIGGGLYYADGYAERRVEQAVAAQLQEELGTPQPPSVEIQQRPFLTQVVTQSLTSVRIVAEDLGVTSEASLVVADLDMILTGVTSDDWFTTMQVSHAEGDARVTYPALQSIAGWPLTYAGGGRVQVVVTATIAGQEVKALVDGALSLNRSEQSVSLADGRITVAGVKLPDITAGALIRTLVKPIPLSGLPFGLTVDSVAAADDGVHAVIVGDDVQIPG